MDTLWQLCVRVQWCGSSTFTVETSLPNTNSMRWVSLCKVVAARETLKLLQNAEKGTREIFLVHHMTSARALNLKP